MKLALLTLLLALASADDTKPDKKPGRRSYVCPPNFIRLSHRCYFFSNEAATWQDAYFQCRDLHSNLAIIKSANQDKLIRRTLSKRTLAPLERWLGGLYDWEQMTWKWAASGKSLTYQGFSQMDRDDKEKLRWHCIIVDPNLQYKWNTRSCVERKHFICHTKIKIVTPKGKKKLLKQYNTKYLNEIPVPTIADDLNFNATSLKDNKANFELNDAQYGFKPKLNKRRKNRKNRKKKLQDHLNIYNSTLVDQLERRKRLKIKAESDMARDKIKWKTYYKEVTISPLHPKQIVEEFNYVKEP